MAERFRLPPSITSSKWVTAGKSATKSALTSREAAAVISAVRETVHSAAWPLWYQFAAVAYGWDPATDALDTGGKQGDLPYAAMPELRAAVDGVMATLDQAGSARTPRLDLVDVFDSRAGEGFRAAIATALRQDGANVAFKIPIPACKDPKTGRPARPIKNPKTGKWECPGGPVTIDDPITAIGGSLVNLAVPIAIILIAAAAFTRAPRRRR